MRKLAEQIVPVVVLATFAINLWAEQPEILEEVLVQSVNGCGSWPIDHGDIATCDYAVLAQPIRSKVPKWRVDAVAGCLVCENNECRPRSFTSIQTPEEDWCRKLFWTPRHIDRLRLTSEEASALEVSFTFEISKQGKVKNIQIDDLYGDWSEQVVQRLLETGAQGVRYPPLSIDGARYSIVNLEASYSLEGGVW